MFHFIDEVFGDQQVGDPAQPGDEAVEVHGMRVEEGHEGHLPGPQGEGREGQGETAVHEGLVGDEVALPGFLVGLPGEIDPEGAQEAEGDPRGQPAIGEEADEKARGSAEEHDGQHIEPAVDAVHRRVVAPDGAGKLRGARGQGEDGRKNVDVESGQVEGDPDIVLLDAQESGVGAGGEILQHDPEHEEAQEAVEQEEQCAGSVLPEGGYRDHSGPNVPLRRRKRKNP